MSRGRLQVYETRQVRVTFDPAKCIHSGVCLATLPEVFDIRRRRWIDPGKAEPQEVLYAVAKCPSGALQAELVTAVLPVGTEDPRDIPGDRVPDAGREGQPATAIKASDRGPLLVTGRFRVVDAAGKTLMEGTSCALCRCGRSANKPFCDGSHKKVDWDALG